MEGVLLKSLIDALAAPDTCSGRGTGRSPGELGFEPHLGIFGWRPVVLIGRVREEGDVKHGELEDGGGTHGDGEAKTLSG